MKRIWQQRGFTLIELSIVLVIIGLIVGGVLAGQALIRAAEVRATITQVEKFNTAARTFYGKYGYLPGDIKDPDATNFGFAPRGGLRGQGDGNQVLEGMPNPAGWEMGGGETVMFWVDLSAAHLIEGNFSTAGSTTMPSSDITGSALDLYFPKAKIGNGYFFVWSGALYDGTEFNSTGVNYFGLQGIGSLSSVDGKLHTTQRNLTVAQAYAIDAKIDDGQPVTGSVLAIYLDTDPIFTDGGPDPNTLYTSSLPSQGGASPSSCFDNGNVSDAPMHYSLQQSSGAGVNCTLSFKFQ